ncbi:MAG: hypothetical protein FWB96_01295 [Defluviitaleaceae bacterium]|nr:hypothetical protein [Defluviitaleaceae bacterium]MCL2261672.1 hypothetical protein [Defluviitaleaceae bacterium]
MKNNDQALAAFMAKIAEAKERIEELNAYADDHIGDSPEEINWGHVGSAGYFVEKLTELTDWAFGRGEYAKD